MSQSLDAESFIQQAQEIEIKKRKRTLLITSIIVLVALLFLALIIFSVNKTNHEKNSLETHIAQKDSALTIIKDASDKAQLQHDSLLSIINTYFRLRKEHNANAIELLYADTVISYFKNLKNISRDVITKSDKQYWAKYTADNISITAPIQISLSPVEDKAIVKVRQCYDEKRCYEELVEMHFDSKFKINYVRAFYDSN